MDGRRLTSLRWVLLPFCMYLAGVALLGDWIIDDAGISFAYARNIAGGEGVVAQPGVAPVEGFSNFLWVLLYVPFFWLRAFDPIWLPKLLGATLVLLSLGLVQRVLSQTAVRRWTAPLATLLIATTPALVIWTASGLENSLLLALVVGLWSVLTLRPARWALLSGALAAGIAMTRPDGLVYAVAVPLVCLVELATRTTPWREALLNGGRALGAFSALWVPFLTFRLSSFGLPFPHTYYAKLAHASQQERLAALLAVHGNELREKLAGLGHAFAGPVGPWLLVACSVAALALRWMGRLSRPAAMALVLLAFAAFVHVWLPDDWMGEFRFATPAVALAWIGVVVVAERALEFLTVGRWRAIAGALLLLPLGVLLVPTNIARLVIFASNPPTPYRAVERQYARRFNAYADSLALPNPSILIADIGAMLLESRLRVYDAAGLIEPQVVRTIRKGTPIWHYDHPEFYDWVFETIKPTFVVTYGFWTNVTSLEFDPRFVRDYVAIDSFPDEYVKVTYGRDVHSGEFVRRDALGTGEDLERMRASYDFEPPVEPLVFRAVAGLRSVGLDGHTGTGDPPWDARAVSIENPNRATFLLTRRLAEVPEDLEARELLASTLDRTGRAAEAHVHWQRLAERAASQNNPVLLQRAAIRLAHVSDAAALVQYASYLHSVGKEAEAVEALGRAIALEPRSAAPHFLLGVIAQTGKRLEEAIEHYRRCLELDPNWVDAQNNLGFGLSLLGRHGEAIPVLENALRIQPGDALVRANLAWAKDELDRASGRAGSAVR